MKKEGMEYPVFASIVASSAGFTHESTKSIVPEEDDNTMAAWERVTTLIEKYIPFKEAQEELEDAIIEHELAAKWLAYKSGIRVTLKIQEEMEKIKSECVYVASKANAAKPKD